MSERVRQTTYLRRCSYFFALLLAASAHLGLARPAQGAEDAHHVEAGALHDCDIVINLFSGTMDKYLANSARWRESRSSSSSEIANFTVNCLGPKKM